MDPILKKLRETMNELLAQRKTHEDARNAVRSACIEGSRDPDDAETAAVRAADEAIAGIDGQLDACRADIAEREQQMARDDAAAKLRREFGGGVQVGAEPATYRKNGPHSYFRDLYMASVYGQRESIERLSRNDAEVRALNTTDTSGGDFVPPQYLVDEFVEKARPGRVFASEVESRPLPAGTDTISLPRITGGTATAVQSTQNNALQDTDAVTDTISASVTTIGGKQVVSVQLVEQSPINIDDVILNDLAADYAQKLDVHALTSNAAGKYGVLNVSGLNAVTYTDGSPTVPEFWPKAIAAAQAIHTGIYRSAQKVFMTPTAWGWLLSAMDSASRPWVVPAAAGPMNALGGSAGAVAEGAAGWLTNLALPVFLDPNIPANLGDANNETRVIVARTSELQLWESAPKAEAFRETKADQLSVLFRMYGYVALQFGRLPKAISVISGTGLITPAL